MSDMQSFIDTALSISAQLTEKVDSAAQMRIEYQSVSDKVTDIKRQLAEFEQKFAMDNAEYVAVPDPRTKRTNKEYSDALMMELLAQNSTWVDLSSAYYAAVAEQGIISTSLTNLVEKVGELKAQARLFSSILIAASDV